MKVGIIRCQEISAGCAGWNCFPAIANKTGEFSQYDSIEIVGFDTCGGCGQGKADKIVKQAKRLQEKGAEVIHLGSCLVGACPSKDIYVKELRKKMKIPIVEKTHGGPNPAQMAAYKAAEEAKKAKRAASRARAKAKK
jgi:predicted metal-binding protein